MSLEAKKKKKNHVYVLNYAYNKLCKKICASVILIIKQATITKIATLPRKQRELHVLRIFNTLHKRNIIDIFKNPAWLLENITADTHKKWYKY